MIFNLWFHGKWREAPEAQRQSLGVAEPCRVRVRQGPIALIYKKMFMVLQATSGQKVQYAVFKFKNSVGQGEGRRAMADDDNGFMAKSR